MQALPSLRGAADVEVHALPALTATNTLMRGAAFEELRMQPMVPVVYFATWCRYWVRLDVQLERAGFVDRVPAVVGLRTWRT